MQRTPRIRKPSPAALVVLLAAAPVLAQSSASYELREHSFSNGGSPAEGSISASVSFRLTLQTVGDTLSSLEMPTSMSFVLDGGFVGFNPPPGEVLNVRFTDESTLVWDQERSAGVYNLYLGDVIDPWDPDYGMCQQPGLPGETAMLTATPPAGQALFILVTAENLLNEEGTKGTTSVGITRVNTAACP